jgi:hypothetical protein
MSSDDFQQQQQQQGGSAVLDEEAESAEESSESEEEEEEEEEPAKQPQPQHKRPLSSRVRVVQGQRKPPLAPKQPAKEAAAPAKRSFLTLAVSARKSRALPCRSTV